MTGMQAARVAETIEKMKRIDLKSDGTIPLLVDQVAMMRDKQFWSTTHTWPWVRSKLFELGLIMEAQAKDREGAEPWQPVTELTDLGEAVRAELKVGAKPTNGSAEADATTDDIAP